MPPDPHRRLPAAVEDEVWAVFELPVAQRGVRVQQLCAQHPELAWRIRRLLLLIEGRGVPVGSLPLAGATGDVRSAEWRLVAEFLWLVVARLGAVDGEPAAGALRTAARQVFEVDFVARPAAAAIVREQLAGCPWLG